MTVNEWLARAAAKLAAGPHAERARRDAEALLLHLTGKDRAWLLAHGGDGLAEDATTACSAFLKRRLSGEPIQYITGQCEFYGLPFRVTPAVLIPRPETEHLVEAVLALAAEFSTPRIVDVGTGSGAIAIALAHKLPNAHVTAVDLSAAALAIARENAERNAVAIHFLQGDLLAPVAGEVFDIVVSNPPYVPATDRDSLSVEVREFEPAQALFAGPDGLDVYRRLIPAARDVLAPGGLLALEIGYGQQEAVQTLLASFGFTQINATPDLQGIPRVFTARRF